MTDKPKLTLSNPKNKLNSESKLSKNTEGVSLTETVSQDKSNRQNSSSTNLPNKNLTNINHNYYFYRKLEMI